MTRKAKFNAIIFLLFVIVTGSYFMLRCVYDPSIPYLRTTEDAQWILYRFPPVLYAIASPQTAVFEKSFDIGGVPDKAVLHINALKAFRLWVNGTTVKTRAIQPSNWKKNRIIDIQPYLRKGRNTVRVQVTCAYGPPALRLYSIGLKPEIRTDAHWKVYSERGPGMSPILADDYPRHPIQTLFPKPLPALVATLPIAIGIFSGLLILFGFLYRCRRHATFSQLCAKLIRSGPKIALLISIGVWIYFFVNNTPKIKPTIGFDAPEHLRYIRYLLEHLTLPSGQALQYKVGQLHNPPLFYILAAVLYRGAELISSGALSLYAVKFLPIACGLGQIWIAYRAAEYFFPDDSSAQTLTVCIAAAMPMNIYMSQYVSNETLCAVLMGLSLLVTLRIMGAGHFVARRFYILAAIIGLAVSAKITALTTLPIIILVLLMKIRSFDEKRGYAYYAHLTGALMVIALLTGWYFIRNYMVWGTPIIANWEGATGIHWWQEPGYATAAYFLKFGKVFFIPFF